MDRVREMKLTSNHVKIVAIAAITMLEAINLMTAKYDGNVLLSLGAIIGGIAGYEYGKRKSSEKQ